MTTQNVMTQCNGRESDATEPMRNGRSFQPHVDIVEDSDGLTVLADMPGVRSEDVDIQFENGQLTIFGRVAPRTIDGARCMSQEYGVGDFQRSFQVSERVDSERITAALNNGVLTLRLPKTTAAKPRKIAVTTREK